MLIDLPEKEWNVLSHKIILLFVVFECGDQIFIKIPKFWVEQSFKNRLYGSKIAEKSLSNDSETFSSHFWRKSNHIWSFRSCKSKSGPGWTRSGHQNGHDSVMIGNIYSFMRHMTILMTWTGSPRSTFAFTWSEWSNTITLPSKVTWKSFWIIWKIFFVDFRSIETILKVLFYS